MDVQKGQKMKEYNRQEQLKEVHEKRREMTDQKVYDAIDALLKDGQLINFNKVSSVSGVSVATLYNHKELRSRIETLRGEIQTYSSNKSKTSSMNDSGKDAIIESLKRKVARLEEENARLKKIADSAIKKEWESL